MRISHYFDRCSIWRRRTTEYSSASSLLLYLKHKKNCLVNIETLSLNSFLRKSGYAAAVGRHLVLTTEAIRDTRPAQGKAKRVRAAREG